MMRRRIASERAFVSLLLLAHAVGSHAVVSHADHDRYVKRVVRSRMGKPAGARSSDKTCAPVISSTDPYIDHLLFESVEPAVQDGTPAASFVQATWPISTDELLRYAVTDMHGYTPFRLGRFFEALDALTADVAYRHTNGATRGLVLVTASHYNSIKLRRTQPGRDLTFRCYVTSTSSSSLEVRTDALQQDEDGNECLVNVCHTTMVALDKATMRPCKGAVPPIVLPEGDEACAARERLELAWEHKAQQAKERAVQLSTHAKESNPPTTDEMVAVHELHRAAVAAKGAPSPRLDLPDEISMHTHES